MAVGAAESGSTSGDLVVCVHGLGRTRHCWWLLRRRLERAGCRTAAWTYSSFGRSIEQLGEDCSSRLAACATDPAFRRVHLVTHSLGGIIVRCALRVLAGGERSRSEQVGETAPQAGKPQVGLPGALGTPVGSEKPAWASKLGTVVMLAPPNCGSAWARRLGPWLGWLAPCLPQLSDPRDSFVNRLAPLPPEVRVTVIAAAKDRKCPLATTHLPGESAHLTVPGRHTLIMYRRDVVTEVLRQLKSSC